VGGPRENQKDNPKGKENFTFHIFWVEIEKREKNEGRGKG